MIIVFVWKKSAQSLMGHASMYVHAGDAGRKFYVSWYPKEEVGAAAVVGVEKCVNGKAYKSLKTEIKQEWKGTLPDLVTSIKGLNEAKIKPAWERLKDEGQWCLAGKNCSTVVYGLLRVAGGPEESKIENYIKGYEKKKGKELDWLEEDHLKSWLAKETKNAWTPIRIHNYATGLASYLRTKSK